MHISAPKNICVFWFRKDECQYIMCMYVCVFILVYVCENRDRSFHLNLCSIRAWVRELLTLGLKMGQSSSCFFNIYLYYTIDDDVGLLNECISVILANEFRHIIFHFTALGRKVGFLLSKKNRPTNRNRDIEFDCKYC